MNAVQNTAATACSACSAGSYAPASSVACTPCPSGYYSSANAALCTKSGTITIIKALYGQNCKVALDVTSIVANKVPCNGKTSCSFVENNALFTDPDVGCAKTFSVAFTCDGVTQYNVSEPARGGEGYGVTLDCAAPPTTGASTTAAPTTTRPTTTTAHTTTTAKVTTTTKTTTTKTTTTKTTTHTTTTTKNPNSIAIVSAVYGKSCGAGLDVTKTVAQKCSGLATCTFVESNALFGDPYSTCPKDFSVVYTCTNNGTTTGPFTIYEPKRGGEGYTVNIVCSSAPAASTAVSSVVGASVGGVLVLLVLVPIVMLIMRANRQKAAISNDNKGTVSNVEAEFDHAAVEQPSDASSAEMKIGSSELSRHSTTFINDPTFWVCISLRVHHAHLINIIFLAGG